MEEMSFGDKIRVEDGADGLLTKSVVSYIFRIPVILLPATILNADIYANRQLYDQLNAISMKVEP